jgi:hypothetical protein
VLPSSELSYFLREECRTVTDDLQPGSVVYRRIGRRQQPLNRLPHSLVMVIGGKFLRIERNEFTILHAAKPGDVFGHGNSPFSASRFNLRNLRRFRSTGQWGPARATGSGVMLLPWLHSPLSRAAVKGRAGACSRGLSFSSDQSAVLHFRARLQLRQPQPTLGLGRMEPLDARISGVQGEPDGFQRSSSEPCRLGMFVHHCSAGLFGFFSSIQISATANNPLTNLAYGNHVRGHSVTPHMPPRTSVPFAAPSSPQGLGAYLLRIITPFLIDGPNGDQVNDPIIGIVSAAETRATQSEP